MFSGSYDHVLDDKGRTSLPKEFRGELTKLKTPPFITGLRECLAIYPSDVFEGIRARLTGDFDVIDSIQHLQRLIIGMATPCSIDRQGRILIPPKLRQWAHLDRELVFTGVGDRIEIWDRARHEAELGQTRMNYGVYTEDLKRPSS